MPAYIVTLKDDISDQEVKTVKDNCKEQGGTIEHEYTIFKGFSVRYPEDQFSTLESHPHVESVEVDGEVRTQK